MGDTMGTLVRNSGGAAGGAKGLQDAIQHLAGRRGLVFLVSDFHWPLAGLGTALDSLVQSFAVPVVIWDAAEIEPPAHNGLAQLRDVESGAQRTLWMRPRMRDKWRESAAARRTELNQVFASRAMRPFYVGVVGSTARAMSQYFFEVSRNEGSNGAVLRSTSPAVVLLSCALWLAAAPSWAIVSAPATSAPAADTPVSGAAGVAIVQQPRPFGYVLGDTLTQRILLQSAGRNFDPATLPPSERAGLWFRGARRESNRLMTGVAGLSSTINSSTPRKP